jgi:hypothetical protein
MRKEKTHHLSFRLLHIAQMQASKSTHLLRLLLFQSLRLQTNLHVAFFQDLPASGTNEATTAASDFHTDVTNLIKASLYSFSRASLALSFIITASSCSLARFSSSSPFLSNTFSRSANIREKAWSFAFLAFSAATIRSLQHTMMFKCWAVPHGCTTMNGRVPLLCRLGDQMMQNHGVCVLFFRSPFRLALNGCFVKTRQLLSMDSCNFLQASCGTMH